jgi:hypothetical protein
VLKGLLRIRRQQARNSVRTPEGRTLLLASTRRRSLGFAGLAPHSGRSSIPFRLTLFRNRRYSFQLPEPPTNYAVPQEHYKQPLTNNRVYGEQRALSNHFRQKPVENFDRSSSLARNQRFVSTAKASTYRAPGPGARPGHSTLLVVAPTRHTRSRLAGSKVRLLENIYLTEI